MSLQIEKEFPHREKLPDHGAINPVFSSCEVWPIVCTYNLHDSIDYAFF
jgi:hypothetical protein